MSAKRNVNKNTLRKQCTTWYNFDPKGIIFPYNNKQIILLTSMRNNNPELYYTEKNTVWEK